VRLGSASWSLLLAGAACLSLASRARGAEPDAASATRAADATEAARAHFKTGVKLYQDANFAGALAEFEAAYELKPGPGSLQNVALCQKALFRYGEAADTLTRLLARHGTELSEAERSAAKKARDELEALVGSVTLALVPANAEVTLDGRSLSVADRAGTLRLNVGEHALVVSAPGYASATRSLAVASGQKDVVVSVELAPTAAFLDVRSGDARASIAIDGKPVAFGHVLAPVTPHEVHLVQIYEDGVAPFEARVTAELGQTVAVNGQPGTSGAPPSSSPSTLAVNAPPPAPPPKPAAGWFAAGSASMLATGSTPFRFDLTGARSSAWGLGARGGYRLRPAVAVAGLAEFDVLKVRHACDEYAGELAPSPVLCGDPNEIVADYLVRSLRFAPAVELMTTDPRLRAIGAIGLGAVWHQIRLGLEQKAGVDPFLLLEIGVGANSKHVLFELTAEALVDGTRRMIDGRDLGPAASVHERAFDRSNGSLAFVGINLRAGYSAWSP